MFFLIVVSITSALNIYKKNLYVSEIPESEWEQLQVFWDSTQAEYVQSQSKLYPFNPNFISDYKAYSIGLSIEEYNRLKDFRSKNKYVNSANEFQQVTKISDSLLMHLKPYFKFPEWTQKNNNNKFQKYNQFQKSTSEVKVKININDATKEQLMKIRGIGDKISDNILKQKEKLGAFVSFKQFYEFYGIDDDVMEQLINNFEIKYEANDLNKININDMSINQMSKFPYFNYNIAKQIVIYRSHHREIKYEDLTKINGFPIEKLEFINLYLNF